MNFTIEKEVFLKALGNAALRSGDYDLAMAAASTALIDDPEWQDPQLLIARTLAALGRYRITSYNVCYTKLLRARGVPRRA